MEKGAANGWSGRYFNRRGLQAHLIALGITTNGNPFDQLAQCYGHPDRHYHNGRHIDTCLQLLAQYQAIATHPHELAIALWFHDAVYDPRKRDNERLSAAWARQCLGAQGVARSTIARITALILGTQDHCPQTDDAQLDDAQLMVDIDLAILGSDRSK